MLNAKLTLKHEDEDPWAAIKRNVTLPFFAGQVMSLSRNQLRISSEFNDRVSELKQLLATSTYLNDREQAMNLKDALWKVVRATEDLRAYRIIRHLEGRVTPNGCDWKMPQGVAELVAEQLKGGLDKQVGWTITELDDAKDKEKESCCWRSRMNQPKSQSTLIRKKVMQAELDTRT